MDSPAPAKPLPIGVTQRRSSVPALGRGLAELVGQPVAPPGAGDVRQILGGVRHMGRLNAADVDGCRRSAQGAMQGRRAVAEEGSAASGAVCYVFGDQVTR